MSSLAAWLRSARLRDGLLTGSLAVVLYLGIDYGLVVVGMESLRTTGFRILTGVLVGVTVSIVFALLAARERE